MSARTCTHAHITANLVEIFALFARRRTVGIQTHILHIVYMLFFSLKAFKGGVEVDKRHEEVFVVIIFVIMLVYISYRADIINTIRIQTYEWQAPL